jgi:hypothetical protein
MGSPKNFFPPKKKKIFLKGKTRKKNVSPQEKNSTFFLFWFLFNFTDFYRPKGALEKLEKGIYFFFF